MKAVVLIPAYNSSQTIAKVVKQVKALGSSVVVVDDDSGDNTSALAEAWGAVVLRNEKNMGKGAALRKGFAYALRNNYDAVITMDADGQHDPLSLNDFLEKAKTTEAELILGNRMHNVIGMPKIRIITNKFMSFILSKKVGQYIPDTQCGYRLIKSSLLKRLTLNTKRYEIESEVIIKAGRAGARIDSIPITSIYEGQVSRINPLVDTWRFVKLMFKT